MDTSGYQYLGILYQIFLLLPSSSTVSDVLELQQTIPANSSLVCPGEKLQYTCRTNGSSLAWKIPGHASMLFDIPNDVNTTKTVGQFELTLNDLNGAGYISTATNTKITSDFDNEEIGCGGGTMPLEEPIAVADGPANCSDVAVTCKATPNSLNDSETDIMVFLSTNSTLMCVVAYQIQFDEQNVTVPASSPSATFIINEAKGQPFLDEKIYTLDYENRTGKVPCLFSIPKPSGVVNIIIKQECETTSQNLSVTISWKPSEIGGCLDEDVTLEYIIECNSSYSDDSHFMTSNTSYILLGIPQGTDLEISVTPILRDLGLKGSALSTAEHVVNTSCLASSSQAAIATTSQTTFLVTSPTTSSATNATVSPTGETGKGWIIGVVFGSLLIVAILFAICFGILFYVCYWQKKDSKKFKRNNREQPSNELECTDFNRTLRSVACTDEEELLKQPTGDEEEALRKEREELERKRLQDERKKIEEELQRLSRERSEVTHRMGQLKCLERCIGEVYRIYAERQQTISEIKELCGTTSDELNEHDDSELQAVKELENDLSELKKLCEKYKVQIDELELQLLNVKPSDAVQTETDLICLLPTYRQSKLMELSTMEERLHHGIDKSRGVQLDKLKTERIMLRDMIKHDKEAKAVTIKEKDAEISRLTQLQDKISESFEKKISLMEKAHQESLDKISESFEKKISLMEKAHQESLAQERKAQQKETKELQGRIDRLLIERDEQKQAQLMDKERINQLSQQIADMRVEAEKRDQEQKKQTEETGKEIKKLRETQQIMQKSIAELQAKSENDDKENQSKDYSDPVLEERAEQGHLGVGKNHSQHLSDSGLPKTATEGYADTQDGYGDDAVLQSSQRDVRPGGQSEFMSVSHAEQPSTSSHEQFVVVPAAQHISPITYSSAGAEIVPGQTVSNGHGESHSSCKPKQISPTVVGMRSDSPCSSTNGGEPSEVESGTVPNTTAETN